MEASYRRAQRRMHDLELLGVYLHRVNEDDLNSYIGHVVKTDRVPEYLEIFDFVVLPSLWGRYAVVCFRGLQCK